MFEGLDSNIYEDIELSRGEIFDLVDDFSRQVAYHDKQSAWRLLVRRATWNFYKDEPNGDVRIRIHFGKHKFEPRLCAAIERGTE